MKNLLKGIVQQKPNGVEIGSTDRYSLGNGSLDNIFKFQKATIVISRDKQLTVSYALIIKILCQY